jgi:thiol:disulfide interchange protein DsbD
MTKYLHPLYLILFIFSSTTQALPEFLKSAKIESKFLPVEQAYICKATIKNNKIFLNWQISDGYYMYADQFKFVIDKNNGQKDELEAIFKQQAISTNDEYFGEQKVFYKNIDIELPTTDTLNGVLRVYFQGCAESGYCYPPSQYKFALNLAEKSIQSIILGK